MEAPSREYTHFQEGFRTGSGPGGSSKEHLRNRLSVEVTPGIPDSIHKMGLVFQTDSAFVVAIVQLNVHSREPNATNVV